MRVKSFTQTFLLGLSLICACTAVFGVEHPDGSFALPDDGDSFYVGFKHIDSTGTGDYPYGYFTVLIQTCSVHVTTSCENDCDGVIELGTSTLTSIPDSDIEVSSLVFNTVGTNLSDTTSNFCAVRDGAGNVWAIDRDLPTVSNITTANSSSRIIPCETTDYFNRMTGCQSSPQTPSVISVNGGFIQLDTTDGSAPLDFHCFETSHNGRMVVDDVSNLLYICTASGWTTTALTPITPPP